MTIPSKKKLKSEADIPEDRQNNAKVMYDVLYLNKKNKYKKNVNFVGYD